MLTLKIEEMGRAGFWAQPVYKFKVRKLVSYTANQV